MGRGWEGLRCTGCGPARAATGRGLTFLAAERRVPGERQEGAQAEEQQRQEGAIAEPHLPRCAAGAGGAEAAWPGGPGPGRGGREAAGAPAPERGGAAGPEEAAAVWAGRGTGGGAGRAAPPRRAALAASVGGWAGAGQGWARRQEPRPGWIRDRRRVDGEGRGGRDLKGPHHPLPLGAPRGGGVGGQRPGSRWAKLGKLGGARMEERTLRERWSSLRKVEATVVMSEGQLLCSRDRLRRCQAPQVCFQEDPIGNSPTPRPQALLPTERV